MGNREFTYLTKIIETGNFSLAAQKLYIAQPSLSQFVKRIEKEIGAELFDRTTKPVTLTYAGKIYMDAEQKIQQINQSRQQQIDDIDLLKKGHVTIGSSHYRSSYFLDKVIPVVKQKYPGIEISLEEGTTKQLEEYSLNGVTDFSIVLSPLFYPELNYEQIFQEEILLAISSNHPISTKENLSYTAHSQYPIVDFSKLANEPFIIIKSGQKMRKSFFNFCEQVKISPPIILESQSMVAAQTLASVGVGATLVPDLLAKYNTLENPPCYFSLRNYLPDRQVIIAYRKDKYISKAANAVIQIMKNIAKQHYTIK
ncbi:LysR family transcriptional regulator [Anaerosinus massiliensis]|uniref:LysR family transcriptional regulator n=1 Tax=Massilibacillus massiliensis TaxID=1806837 RepID=UPI000AEF2524|nr:LysR family transcriptional regulator [Massilibacillus massiliensis]